MNTYRLTDEELKELLEASKPVPYMVIGGREPRSPRENVMDVWKKIAKDKGCDVDSIDSAGTGDQHDFKANPL